ncbi:hypothetical protein [Trichlorobacter lovleyi]|uniref:Transmembrane protein n=1 Tax=Trichlorobacter lovleyi (strain ATCC BAA-1151 / DSM 17278 / SZ) TaxID=398767 RepID=B3E5M2_TRIL1|nr:hypothetical protein [Trichlorobacter lovleyi]ACD94693.1 hypothetical protein Glov_0970 [Trichlorobacter lovleyi SZ]
MANDAALDSQPDLAPDERPVIRKVKTKPVSDPPPVLVDTSRLVFSDEFVMDSVGIEQKEILSYINGKAIPLLGDDFYYSYQYLNGILSFIALKSKQHVAGRLPLFYPALILQGNFVYKKTDADYFYYLTNKDGFCSAEVAYEERPNHLMIQQVPVNSPPATLKLTWSLARKNLFLNAALLAFLGLSTLFLALSAKGYDTARKEQQRLVAQVAPVIPRGLPSFINSVADLGKKIEGKGFIVKVALAKDQLTCTIKFNQDADAQVFLRTTGGNYEGDKVIYTTALSAAR